MTEYVFGFCRSHAQLQKLGEQLDLDAAGAGNEDDSKINTMTDDEMGGYACQLNESQMNSSPHRKRSRASIGVQDALNQGSIEVYMYIIILLMFNLYSLWEVLCVFLYSVAFSSIIQFPTFWSLCYVCVIPLQS